MDRPKLTVHIGAPKTGTTLLQRQASEHRMLLEAEGLLYPVRILRGYGHHDLAFLLDGGFPDWATPAEVTLDDLAAGLAEDCAGHTGDILLSSENFFLFPQPARLARLLEDTGLSRGRRVSVLLYLRRQDDLLESWYNQAVKAQGYTGSIEDMVAAPPAFLDFVAGVDAWAGVFGREAMDLRIYEEATATGLERDFWDRVKPGLAERVPRAKAAVNTRIGRDVIEVQRILNGLDLPIVEKRRFHREFMAISQDGKPEAPLLSDALRDRVMETYRAGNEALSVDWFGGRAIFPEPVRAGVEPVPYPGLRVERAVEIFVEAFLRAKGRD